MSEAGVVSPEGVAAVIVTRGDVDLRPSLDGLPFPEIGVWDNEPDLVVYGRYAAIENVTAPVCYTQDDDVIVPPETIGKLLAAYQPGSIVCNVPERFRSRYHDSGLVGFGALFDRHLPAVAFARFREAFPQTDETWFRRNCDVVFTMLTPCVQVDLPYADREYARHANRMWRQDGHFESMEKMRQLCRQVRDGRVA